MGWALPDEAFEYLAPRLRALGDAPVVELGSGQGTARLANMVPRGKLYSVEHDEKWLDRYLTNYIHAPIVDGWYDPEVLRRSLPANIGAVIVDGPPCSIGRKRLLDYLDLFGDAPMFIDDTHRTEEALMAAEVALRRGALCDVHLLPSTRGFTAVGWGTSL